MVPSPMLIDVDQENKLEVGLKVPLNQDDKNLRCTNNCEDTNFDMEALLDQQTVVPAAAESSEVEIIECTNASEIRLPEGDDPDATEYSSSFGDTVSGNDDGSRLSDAEVESHFCGDNGLGANVFDGFSSLFQMRKKKLTAHWRRYIRPLMWRCKWVELRIKEFRAQALKYDRELAAYEQRKQLELGQYASEGCGRTLPFCRQIYRKKPMKRRKRKKSEDMVDIPSYMSLHNLFSYYDLFSIASFNCKSFVSLLNLSIILIAADVNSNDELDVNCEWPSLECRDGDNSIEQILWKIEIAQSKAQKLKTQVDKLLSTNAGKFSSMENLSLLVSSDLPTSSARSPTFSPRHGDAMPIGALYTPPRHISEYEIGDLVMPESAVSSYGEVTPLPDIIESTVGLLSAAEASLDHPQDGDSCKDLVDNVIINNHAAEKELHSFEKVSTLPTKVKEEQEEKNIVTPLVAAAPEPEQPAQETIVPKEESVMKLTLCSEIHVPKNKRKRGERKPGSGAWNAEKISTQRSSGEPDN
ncbi:hypothetical protein BVC80_1827g89 [Macleaya cordata]|uniref:Uncharacterized protein n=1 Tax=Macleaya cordata TaxID=56857 RepID=A0A200QB79_MACCD|nr:hypothetical protein BVC80_1827g89 [Macleaya cordata]